MGDFHHESKIEDMVSALQMDFCCGDFVFSFPGGVGGGVVLLG